MTDPKDDPSYVPDSDLSQVEQFVNWVGRSAALSEVFPPYVLEDSTDYRRAQLGVATLLPHVLEVAGRINPTLAERIETGVAGDDSLGAVANVCQGIIRTLERANPDDPIVDCDGTVVVEPD
jgi:hypothetical protein